MQSVQKHKTQTISHSISHADKMSVCGRASAAPPLTQTLCFFSVGVQDLVFYLIMLNSAKQIFGVKYLINIKPYVGFSALSLNRHTLDPANSKANELSWQMDLLMIRSLSVFHPCFCYRYLTGCKQLALLSHKDFTVYFSEGPLAGTGDQFEFRPVYPLMNE